MQKEIAKFKLPERLKILDDLPVSTFGKVSKKALSNGRTRPRAQPRWTGTMRIIDLHCYPGTHEWIACQGPYVEALAKYWNRQWVGKSEDEVLKEFTDAGVEAVLVALDLETTIATPPFTNEYVARDVASGTRSGSSRPGARSSPPRARPPSSRCARRCASSA